MTTEPELIYSGYSHNKALAALMRESGRSRESCERTLRIAKRWKCDIVGTVPPLAVVCVRIGAVFSGKYFWLVGRIPEG